MHTITTPETFKAHVQTLQKSPNYREPLGFGICRVDVGQLDRTKVLQATYPMVNWKENFGSAAVFLDTLQQSGASVETQGSEFIAPVTEAFLEHALAAFSPYIDEAHGEAHKNVQLILGIKEILNEQGFWPTQYRVVFLFEDSAPQSVEAVYLKLYALSLAKAPLRSLNLTGAFGKLHNVAWSGNTPIELAWLRANEIDLKLRNEFPVIDFVDKFPRFLQHIIPADNTRILEASKVRFGAQIHAGTTIMPGASYVNFNAGTTGTSMVEGRISSSAIVGDGTDVGGGASILGVLSGTDGNPITIGKNSLLGANCVCGIPLGDGCIIDAGIAVLEGTKFSVTVAERAKINEVNSVKLDKEVYKGKEIAGFNGIHFRQNSLTGEMSIGRSKREIKLNAELH
ncbi:MAG: 2,3,4,5-tetrahydropyridine-2,6-carboxylate N-succinyltransferase [Sulfuricurvum sp. PC08-66]|nr:MAG: 2,3,4,5-tetrahydropyridine-2,6-carboxylate N-succinyltransferase [Sulfuricurvum sp. PC08-66]